MEFEGFSTNTFTTTDDIKIHFGTNFSADKRSEKGTIVFNYGLVCNIAHYKHQIPYFHELGYDVVFHDYRFHFNSSSTSSIEDLSFKKISQDMDCLLSFLNVEKAIHIGHSMGVNTTLEFARNHPDKV
ncbi:MAG: alpha/beta hydrolase, partial [Halobacteriovoraceae bacterium]|nr:alpha/beta hydrolase [Halobacteriovoraceae bacterium]